MLKKLRHKFIFINMLIVTIMLSIISGALYLATSNGLERESIEMMERLAREPIPFQMFRPNAGQREANIPYFSVMVDSSGNVLEIEGGLFDLSDETILNELISAAISDEDGRGTLKQYNLRFLCSDKKFGTYIIFTDMSAEQATLKSMLEPMLLVDLAAFFIFFIISVLLARWAVKPVDEAWKQQKQFVADASHELKTPLTVIMTNAEMISDSSCTEEEKDKLSKNILTMTHQMRGLVESLLELARIDNGTVKEQMALVSFSDIVSSSAMVFEPIFFEKDMNFEYSIAEGINVMGNASHLKQLVDILLDNASKYTKEGGKVNLSLKLAGKKAVLEVSDEGEPISAEDLKNLFKRFYRADKARAMNHSYGLGLSIAQSIAEEHKGRIWAESRDGINKFIAEIAL